MIPAAELSAITEKLFLGLSVKKITNAPAVVIRQVNSEAIVACQTGERFCKKFIGKFIPFSSCQRLPPKNGGTSLISSIFPEAFFVSRLSLALLSYLPLISPVCFRFASSLYPRFFRTQKRARGPAADALFILPFIRFPDRKNSLSSSPFSRLSGYPPPRRALPCSPRTEYPTPREYPPPAFRGANE